MGWLRAEEISQRINQAFALREVVAIKDLLDYQDETEQEQSAAEIVMMELHDGGFIEPVEKKDSDWLKMIAGLDPEKDFYYEDPEYYEALHAIRYRAKTKNLRVYKGWDL